MRPMTIMTPRYRIESVKGDFFDVFNQRKNAINEAIKLAIEYPGSTFVVVKKVNHKSKAIFRFKIEADFSFEDIQNVYRSLIEVYQKKLDKTKYWRKLDVSR